MHGRIPPLNPLKVFEVVARTRNLTQAARELHISQSAVSKQLNVLQTYLGVELFRRERHGISLTLAGQRYGEAVAPAFEGIGRATDEIMRSGSDNTLRLQTYTTFAAKWLIPRLQDFNARSEEHTSELQSPCNLVCRLLLEKKNISIACTHSPALHHTTRTTT